MSGFLFAFFRDTLDGFRSALGYFGVPRAELEQNMLCFAAFTGGQGIPWGARGRSHGGGVPPLFGRGGATIGGGSSTG